jgi:hypothetical protein
MRRLALVGVWSITHYCCVERNTTKPFNPLLGETFEYVNDDFTYLAEQVSHHPPQVAYHCVGKEGYVVWSNNRAKTKFNGKQVNVIPIYKVYVELPAYKELYEVSLPTVSAHNLIIGTLYLDIGGKSKIRKCGT